MFYTYILRSLSQPEQRYIGSTSDLKSRLAKHNAGEVPHTTKLLDGILRMKRDWLTCKSKLSVRAVKSSICGIIPNLHQTKQERTLPILYPHLRKSQSPKLKKGKK